MNINIVKTFINLRKQSLSLKKIESKISVLEQSYKTRFENIEQLICERRRTTIEEIHKKIISSAAV